MKFQNKRSLPTKVILFLTAILLLSRPGYTDTPRPDNNDIKVTPAPWDQMIIHTAQNTVAPGPSVGAIQTSTDTPRNWPKYSGELSGRNPIRVRNPNDFSVKVGLRSSGKGKDFSVPARDVNTVYVPDGSYEIFFNYSSDPKSLYKGDNFTLSQNGVEIKIVKVVHGNYGIRKVE